MTEVFIIIAVLFYLAIFIFGYTKDYKRNPREFVRTIIGMPLGMFFSTLGFKEIDKEIKKWTEKRDKKTNN